jgi:hypothetical protein
MKMARRLRRRVRRGTCLDEPIAPEIQADPFYEAIVRVAATAGVSQILEIGASGGAGSTEALIQGALQNPVRPTIHCIEVSAIRYQALKERHQALAFVRCYNVSSVASDQFPSRDQVVEFYSSVKSSLNDYPIATVLSWLDQDVTYVRKHGLDTNGIREVMSASGVDAFDAVLIDGSEFTGTVELNEVYGASYLLLDDVCSFKNYENNARLLADPNYVLIEASTRVRNGYAVFQWRAHGPAQRAAPNIHGVGNAIASEPSPRTFEWAITRPMN